MSSNKSFSSETANRYALALYELAKENSELEVVEKNINELLAVYNSSGDLKNFIILLNDEDWYCADPIKI